MIQPTREKTLSALLEHGIVLVPSFLSPKQIEKLQVYICDIHFEEYKDFEVHIIVQGAELNETSFAITDFLEPVRNRDMFKTPLVYGKPIIHKFKKHRTPFPIRQEKKCFIDVIAHVVIEGEGELTIYDKTKTQPLFSFIARPGDLVLVRGTGLCGENIRPPHQGKCGSSVVIIASFRKVFPNKTDPQQKVSRKPYF